MKTINKIITPVNGKFGAPMGRPNVGTKPNDKKVFDCMVPLNSGYDKGGAYWGNGEQLRVRYTKDLSYIEFYRVRSFRAKIWNMVTKTFHKNSVTKTDFSIFVTGFDESEALEKAGNYLTINENESIKLFNS